MRTAVPFTRRTSLSRIILLLMALCLFLALPSLVASAADPLVVNTVDDQDDGVCDGTHCSLREAIAASAPGDTILFDPSTFDPASPAAIQIESALPELVAGGVTLDASAAGAIVDGSQLGNRDKVLVLDDISLEFDHDGNNRIQNGGFDAGLAYWRFWESDPGATREVVNTSYGTPPSLQWTTRVAYGFNHMAYDVSGSSDPIPDGPRDPNSTVWMDAVGHTFVRISFNCVGEGFVLVVDGLFADGEERTLSAWGFGPTDTWHTEDREMTLPPDLVKLTFFFEYYDTDRWINGLALGSSDNVVRGLQVLDFPGDGIRIHNGGQRNTIENCVLSGNGESGLSLRGPGTDENVLSGNRCGTTADGSAAHANGEGIGVWNGSHNVIADNVASGNLRGGIGVGGTDSQHNTIRGNLVGLDATGAYAVPNGDVGMNVGDGASYNTIGGTTPADRNVISGNNSTGLIMCCEGSHDNVIIGNYVGTDASGMVAIPNHVAGGIHLYGGAVNNRIGGVAPGEANLISGNEGNGIQIEMHWGGTENNAIQGNWIGLDATGAPTLGNTSNGVEILPGAASITVGPDNVIAGNAWNGVRVWGQDTVFNTITQNSIYANGGAGIELAEGGNTELAAPEIATADVAAGTAAGTAWPDCIIEVFSDDGSQGRIYEGAATSDGAGNWSFAKGEAFGAANVTATATDADGNTSAFGAGARTLVVNTTDDVDDGVCSTAHCSLREAMMVAQPGETITFAPQIHGQSIALEHALPDLWRGGVTIDGTDAQIMIDGAGIGETPETLRLDDFALTADGGANLLENGDFSAGTAHWRPHDQYPDHPAVLRTTGGADVISAPAAYEWTTAAHAGWGTLFYDTRPIDDRVDAPPHGMPGRDDDMWISLPDNTQRLNLSFAHKGPGRLRVALTVHYVAGYEEDIGWLDLSGATDWTLEDHSWDLPEAADRALLYMEWNHSETDTDGFLFVSPDNAVIGLEIANFARHGIGFGGAEATRNLVARNYVHDNLWKGAWMGGVGPDNVFLGNTFTHHAAGHIDIDGTPGTRIEGNTFGWTEVDAVGAWREETRDTVFVGNYFGVDANGNIMPNGGGIVVLDGASNTQIGGTAPSEGNIIAHNQGRGITVGWGAGPGTTVVGNTLVSNGQAGLGILDASSVAVSENEIASNGFNGILVQGQDAVYNTLSQNSIYANGGAGIELADGGNTELAAPRITTADMAAGTVSGTACPDCIVEVFSDDADQGRVYEGTAVADSNGDWAFDKGEPFGAPGLTSTATDADGNTSEFGKGPAVPDENGFALDGESDEWIAVPLAASDALGDSICGPETDLSECYVYTTEDYVYIMQRVANDRADLGWFHIHLQYTNDTGFHHQFIELQGTSCALLENPSYAFVADVDGALGSVVEIRLPWALLGTPRDLFIWPVSPKPGTEPCDELPGFTVANPGFVPQTLVVNTTDDHYDGVCDSADCSLPEALDLAWPGDTVRFDTTVFPPEAPATIHVARPLPPLFRGGITVDASDAGVIIDGTALGIPPHVVMDDISLTADGVELIENGDLSAGMAHWRGFDPMGSATRTVTEVEYRSTPYALDWSQDLTTFASLTYYDTDDTVPDEPFAGFPANDPNSTIWIPAVGGQALTLRFWYRDGPVNASLLATYSDGHMSQAAWIRFEESAVWTEAILDAVLPNDAVGVGIEFSQNSPHGPVPPGLVVPSSDNTIQGLSITGFPGEGIILDWGTSNNTLTDCSVTNNGGIGIQIVSASSNVVRDNLVSGNGWRGINLTGPCADNIVAGNRIGTDASGTVAMPNTDVGIAIEGGGTGNVIGGPNAGDGNLVSGNGSTGIIVCDGGTTGNMVLGNTVGTDLSGMVALPNSGPGIHVYGGAVSNSVGGLGPNDGNLVSGNLYSGVQLGIGWGGTDGNTVLGNRIGIDAAGAPTLGNGQHGVSVEYGAAWSQIGPNNTIAGNSEHGVAVVGADTMGNTITHNSIFRNGGLGIALIDGGNGELPAPQITSYDPVTGTVSGIACPDCGVEVFSDNANQGRVYEGTVVAASDGTWQLAPADGLMGPVITATATDPEGSTSQLSDPAAPPFTSCAECSEIPQHECEALVALYNATNGPAWTNSENWLESSLPSTWYGVTVVNAHVTRLDLPMNGLDGPLPTEIGNLSFLTVLGLPLNQLTGPLPDSLGGLAELHVLDLDTNAITGPLPNLSGLLNLESLVLFGNQLSGPLPETWGQPILGEVSLNDNQFTGGIPQGLRELPSLWWLDLSRNNLSGAIPGIWDAPLLPQLNLDGNQFTSLPVVWEGLPALGSLSASENQIGSIPEGIAFPPSLGWLYLRDNEIVSPLPLALADLPLGGIDLSGNQLTGPLPTWLAGIEELVDLNLARNAFEGPIPPEYGELGVWRLDLSDNLLSGEIPPELGLIGRDEPDGSRSYTLNLLLMNANNLSGSLSTELVEALALQPGLFILDLSDNQLSGELPAAIGQLAPAPELRLNDNHFSGAMPPEIGGIPAARAVSLQRNHLSEAIPGALGNWADLMSLNLAENALEGAVPAEIMGAGANTWPWCGPCCPDMCWWDLGQNRLDVAGTDTAVDLFLVERDADWASTQWPGRETVGPDQTAHLGADLAVRLAEVTVEGRTDVDTYAQLPAPLPAGYEALPVVFEVSSSAAFDAGLGLDLTVPYSDRGIDPVAEERMALLQYVGGAWIDRTTSADTAANTVSGHSDALGTYVVAIGPDNQPPALSPITAPLDPVMLGTLVEASAPLYDPNPGDTHEATWDWGDGTTSAGTIDEPNGLVSGQHTYAEPGVYTISLTVTDAAGASDVETYQYIVVYDPEGGFVTGGGWIMSPEGAYVADPTLTGKASFGFVAKYKKGANVPTGQTQFQFKVADIDFHSESYDWLVVAGPKAKFKGAGTINGAGDYGFMITGVDAALTPSTDVDLFRIKIWDRGNGDAVVYDNLLGADDETPPTALGGGSIVIHKSK